jgi:hypothetical protein
LQHPLEPYEAEVHKKPKPNPVHRVLLPATNPKLFHCNLKDPRIKHLGDLLEHCRIDVCGRSAVVEAGSRI